MRRTAPRTTHLPLLFLPALLAAGCLQLGSAEPPAGPTSQERQLKQHCDEIERDNATLRNRLSICESRMREIILRDNILSDRVRQLQSLKDQLELQIELLSKVPIERDEYKARSDRLATEVYQLRKQLDTLQAATRTATRPARTP